MRRGWGGGGCGGLTTTRGARFRVWHMSPAVCVVVFGSSEKETYSWVIDMSEKSGVLVWHSDGSHEVLACRLLPVIGTKMRCIQRNVLKSPEFP